MPVFGWLWKNYLTLTVTEYFWAQVVAQREAGHSAAGAPASDPNYLWHSGLGPLHTSKLGKLLNVLLFLFPHLQNENNNNCCFIGLFSGLSKLKYLILENAL